MTEKIDIVINGIDNATKEIKQITNSVNKLDDNVQDSRMAFTEFNSALMLAEKGLGFLKQAYEAVVDPTIKYADAVRDVMYLSGQTAEESSRIIQVLDDFKVSTSALEMAQKSLSKEGLTLTVDTLAKLSDQYIELGNDADRTAFLIKNFGRSGMQMAELMRQGGVAIREANDAIEKNLLLTNKEVAAARQYEKALDSLNDTQQGLAITIGNKVVPILERNLSGIKSYIDAIQIATKKGNIYGTMWEFVNLRIKDNNQRLIDAENNMLLAGDSMETAAEKAKKLADAEKEAADRAKELSDMNKDLYSTIMDVQHENDKYTTKLIDLQTEEQKLNGELNNLIAQGWSPTSEKVQDVTNKLNDNKQAMTDLATEHDRAMSLMTYNLFIAKLQADGFTDAEFDMALQAGLTAGVLDQKSVDMARAMNDTANAATGAKDETVKLKTAVDNLANKTVYVDVVTRYTDDYGRRAAGTAPGRASGGSASGLTWVGERGPELVDLPPGSYVHSNSDSKQMASSGGITLVYSPMISLASEAEAERVLLPMLRKLQRQVG
jgi:hypothetical protein